METTEKQGNIHTKRLHSKIIVPFVIAEQGQEKIIEWIEKEQATYRFREGEEVAHKEWPEQKMFVDEILKVKKEMPTGFGQGKRTVERMIGIVVHWIEKNAGPVQV